MIETYARLEAWLIALRGWRRALVSFGAGVATAFAFAPTHLGPVLFAAIPCLLVLITRCPVSCISPANVSARSETDHASPTSSWSAFMTAWLFGFGFHLVGLHWIGNAFLVQADVFAWALPFAVTLMPAGLALFFGLAGVVTARVPSRVLAPWAVFVVAFSLAEFARATVFTGFPWNIVGYAITWPLAPMQILSVTGLHGATVIAFIMALLPALVVSRAAARRGGVEAAKGRTFGGAGLAFVAALILPMAALFAFGAYRLALPLPADQPAIKLRIVQPSIDQTRKWRPDQQRAIFDEHLQLARQGPDGALPDLAGITHVIWAEASMPFRPLKSQPALREIDRMLPADVTLIAGLLRGPTTIGLSVVGELNRAPRVYNSVVAFDDTARPLATYDKIHLVPFGEYLPFPRLLSAIGFETLVRQRGGFTPGPRPRSVFRASGLPPIEMLICYEAIFPHEIGRTIIRPAALFNLTNDGWFGTLSGPYQHFHQTRARAVEQGLPLVRVSNNGISAVVDPYGRIKASIGLNVVGAIDSNLPKPIEQPIAGRFANQIFAVFLALVAAFGVIARR
ncbi:MAG: apolipoprotein N-acyltransferase [Pseudomonadota bacterium]